MFTTYELQNLNHAARIYERQGVAGFNDVARKFGEDMAKGMLIMYLRVLNGSLARGEANIRVPQAIKQLLRDNAMFNDEVAENDRMEALQEAHNKAQEYIRSQSGPTPERPLHRPRHQPQQVRQQRQRETVEELLERLRREQRGKQDG